MISSKSYPAFRQDRIDRQHIITTEPDGDKTIFRQNNRQTDKYSNLSVMISSLSYLAFRQDRIDRQPIITTEPANDKTISDRITDRQTNIRTCHS